MKILCTIEDIPSKNSNYFDFINDPGMNKYLLKNGIPVYEKLNLV